MLKKIGISMRCETYFQGKEVRDELAQDWHQLFLKHHAEAILVPIPNIRKKALEYFEKMELDGLILSGGNDIGAYPQRDQTEFELITHCLSKEIPILGICRGMQILHHYYQGKLIRCDEKKHVAKKHTITIQKCFASFIEAKEYHVNSYHQFALEQKSLHGNWETFAIAEDGEIEGIKHKQHKIMAIMWHPEREEKLSDLSQKILQVFFTEGI